MITMLFSSLYMIVDSVFIARYVGSIGLSATNIVDPVIWILTAFGIMLATGGNAVIGLHMGQGHIDKAREELTQFVIVGVVFGLIFSFTVIVFIYPLVSLLGADDSLKSYCVTYLRTYIMFAPITMLQLLFHAFLVTAGRASLSLVLTTTAGIVNAVLDYLFLCVFGFGIGSAAIATGFGQCITGVAGLLFFASKRNSLCFKRFILNVSVLFKACANGASEMIGNLSTAIVTYLFNIILMRLEGAEGVAAISIILWGQFVFNALYSGFVNGVAPIFSYDFGAGRSVHLKKFYHKCNFFVLLISFLTMILAYVSAGFLSAMFVPEGSKTYILAREGAAIFALNYLFSGFNIYTTGMFTALSDGRTSAAVAFMRTFVFVTSALLLLPYFYGLKGVWIAVPLAELMTFLLSITFHLRKMVGKPGR